MSVVHVDFRAKPKAPEGVAVAAATAPEAAPSFPIPDFLTADLAPAWLHANFRKDTLDAVALSSVCIRNDMGALVALMEGSDDETVCAVGAHLREVLARYEATEPARRPSARQLAGATMAHREKDLALPEGWQTDRAVCAALIAEAGRMPRKAPPKAPPPVVQDWRPAQPFGARFDVLREVADELGLDAATVAAVDQRLAAKLRIQAARPVPACVRGSRSKIAKQFEGMLSEHFDIERVAFSGRREYEVAVALPKPHCAWHDPIALVDIEGRLGFDGQKAVTDALAFGLDLIHSLVADKAVAERHDMELVDWVGVFSSSDRLEGHYDGMDLAAKFGVGVFFIDEIRTGWDLRFQVGEKTVWSSLSGARLAQAL